MTDWAAVQDLAGDLVEADAYGTPGAVAYIIAVENTRDAITRQIRNLERCNP
jgi:hypothetical protein